MSKARRLQFVRAFLGEAAGNATKAAILAGYSENSAKQTASRLLTYVDVRAAIEKAQGTLARKAGFTAEKVIEELAVVAECTPEKYTGGDKLKALELLGKANGLFKDKQGDSRITVNIGFLMTTPPADQPTTLEASVMPRLPQVQISED